VVGRQDDLEAPDPSCHSPRIMNDSGSIDSIAYQTNRISLPGPRNRSDLRVALTRRGRGKYLRRVGGIGGSCTSRSGSDPCRTDGENT